MTRDELGQSLNLIENYIPIENRNRPQLRLLPREIAIHNTSNTAAGADARAHARHLINNSGDSGYGPTSWHYTVDDTEVVKHLPLGEVGFHAYASGNSVALGIELCMNSDGSWESTVDRTARLVTALCFDFGWGYEDIKQHNNYPRGDGTFKDCPVKMRASGGEGWENFISLVQHYLSLVHQAEGFPMGFKTKKEASDSEGPVIGTPESMTNFNELMDIDHGEIIIPTELLSEAK